MSQANPNLHVSEGVMPHARIVLLEEGKCISTYGCPNPQLFVLIRSPTECTILPRLLPEHFQPSI